MHSVILYFGSFNPVHKGHMAVAEWILEQGLCNEVWFVVSPQNPLKRDGSLIGEEERLAMVRLSAYSVISSGEASIAAVSRSTDRTVSGHDILPAGGKRHSRPDNAMEGVEETAGQL